ncbi:MAG: hypothetical protein ACRD2T_14275, partial [Thermoanaerobaculia bacterium]
GKLHEWNFPARRAFRPAAPLAALPWDEVPVLASLVRTEDGGPPAQATALRACWDGAALYVRWECGPGLGDRPSNRPRL